MPLPRGRKRSPPRNLELPASEIPANAANAANAFLANHVMAVALADPRQCHDSKSKFNKLRKCTKDGDEENEFDRERLKTWFRKYAIKNSKLIEPEGMELFCRDINVQPEDIVMLIFAYKMNAKQMGYFSRDEWFRLMVPIQCDSLQKFLRKIPDFRRLLEDKAIFKELYRFAFDFSKDNYQKTVDVATASQMLQLLLADKWPLLSDFFEFLKTFGHKTINRDQWCNLLEFSRNILPDLSNYDVDGAWPVILDEFVEWLSTKNSTKANI